MEIILKNTKLTAIIDTKGAELKSLKSTEGIEYIWNGNPEYWGRHTPVLFPFVGRLKDDQYTFEGKTYHVGQHGFARDNEFELLSQNATTAVFSFKFSEKTLELYPFKFELVITYDLTPDGIQTTWRVINLDEQTMYYGIGGHPAFNLPLEEGLSFEDYYFEISPGGTKTRMPFVPPYLDSQNTVQEEVGKIAISRELFAGDALVFETPESTSITIKSDKSAHSLTLSYEKMPYLGLWSTYPVESPFVCIEPWWSFADTLNDTGELMQKTSIQTLEVGKEFETSYLISVK
ncbi:MAG: aldose 1-epimerase family protein [Streptococcaceae bacterium]|jgi:galactose mutarotase-like enzyme|nr:aldose 1-epimerase family protein [Streptococcaceae bacterium]